MILFRSLRHRSFALLWSGQTISRLGDSLYRIALAWWVLEKTGSATAMGTVLVFSTAPMLLFLLIGGVAVDRFPRVKLMLVSDLLRGAVVGIIALLAFANLLEIWHIYLAGIAFGFVGAFFQPAYTAIVPEITPREALPSANSLTSLSGQLTGIAGPALGASIVALGGTPTAFALDGLSFFISAACLIGITQSGSPPARASRETNVFRDLREGIGTVLASPWLWITIALAALSNVTVAGPLGITLPFLIKDSLHADVGALGLVYSMESVGQVLGAVWLGRYARIHRRGVIGYGAWALGGLCILAMGLPIGVVGVSVAALGFGIFISAFGLIWTNTLQELVPRALLGRVSSIDYLGSFALLPVGFGIAGVATDWLGAPRIFVIGGAVTALLGALGFLHPAIRNLD